MSITCLAQVKNTYFGKIVLRGCGGTEQHYLLHQENDIYYLSIYNIRGKCSNYLAFYTPLKVSNKKNIWLEEEKANIYITTEKKVFFKNMKILINHKEINEEEMILYKTHQMNKIIFEAQGILQSLFGTSSEWVEEKTKFWEMEIPEKEKIFDKIIDINAYMRLPMSYASYDSANRKMQKWVKTMVEEYKYIKEQEFQEILNNLQNIDSTYRERFYKKLGMIECYAHNNDIPVSFYYKPYTPYTLIYGYYNQRILYHFALQFPNEFVKEIQNQMQCGSQIYFRIEDIFIELLYPSSTLNKLYKTWDLQSFYCKLMNVKELDKYTKKWFLKDLKRMYKLSKCKN
jgi:hypothetical protein